MMNFESMELSNKYINRKPIKKGVEKSKMRIKISKLTIIKLVISVILTVFFQYLCVVENGYWGLGGNMFVPLMCYLLFWGLPNILKGDK